MTSSTPRKSSTPLFHSDPVQSPFPLSPLQTSSPPSQRDHQNLNNNHELREIKTIFELFDPTLSGLLDISTFESMMLSLGYRVDSHDILDIIKSILKDEHSSSSSDDEFDGSIDLSMAIEILSKKGYTTKQRNLEDEARVYFRLFDVDGKGYITIDDLKRVMQCEAAVQSEQEVTDDFCQAIIDKFDNSGNGTIVFDDFKRIVDPILA